MGEFDLSLFEEALQSVDGPTKLSLIFGTDVSEYPGRYFDYVNIGEGVLEAATSVAITVQDAERMGIEFYSGAPKYDHIIPPTHPVDLEILAKKGISLFPISDDYGVITRRQVIYRLQDGEVISRIIDLEAGSETWRHLNTRIRREGTIKFFSQLARIMDDGGVVRLEALQGPVGYASWEEFCLLLDQARAIAGGGFTAINGNRLREPYEANSKIIAAHLGCPRQQHTAFWAKLEFEDDSPDDDDLEDCPPVDPYIDRLPIGNLDQQPVFA